MTDTKLASSFRVTGAGDTLPASPDTPKPAPKGFDKTQVYTPPTRKPRVNKISHSEASKGYRYADKDPDMYAILFLIDESGLSDAKLCQETGLTTSTLNNWRMGRTKRPAPSSKRIVLKVLNIVRRYFIGDKEIIIPGYLQMEQTMADVAIAQKMAPKVIKR